MKYSIICIGICLFIYACQNMSEEVYFPDVGCATISNDSLYCVCLNESLPDTFHIDYDQDGKQEIAYTYRNLDLNHYQYVRNLGSIYSTHSFLLFDNNTSNYCTYEEIKELSYEKVLTLMKKEYPDYEEEGFWSTGRTATPPLHLNGDSLSSEKFNGCKYRMFDDNENWIGHIIFTRDSSELVKPNRWCSSGFELYQRPIDGGTMVAHWRPKDGKCPIGDSIYTEIYPNDELVMKKTFRGYESQSSYELRICEGDSLINPRRDSIAFFAAPCLEAINYFWRDTVWRNDTTLVINKWYNKYYQPKTTRQRQENQKELIARQTIYFDKAGFCKRVEKEDWDINYDNGFYFKEGKLGTKKYYDRDSNVYESRTIDDFFDSFGRPIKNPSIILRLYRKDYYTNGILKSNIEGTGMARVGNDDGWGGQKHEILAQMASGKPTKWDVWDYGYDEFLYHNIQYTDTLHYIPNPEGWQLWMPYVHMDEFK